MSLNDLLGLEYLLLFGLPDNKLEVIDGRTRCCCPFLDRGVAEAHFEHWVETLCRWKGVEGSPGVRESGENWKTEVAGFKCELFPLPIEFRIPWEMDAYDAILHTYWWRDPWPGQPRGYESGWGCFLDHQDVSLNVWTLFRRLAGKLGGKSGSRTDIALTERSAVAPDNYLYVVAADECTINGDYFQGPPHVIAEILSPPSEAVDRGPRMELYARAGVSHLWLIDTERETLEVHALADGRYHLGKTFRPGDSFVPSWCPDEMVDVNELFQTQCKRNADRRLSEQAHVRTGIMKVGQRHVLPDKLPRWLCKREVRLGLEYLFLLGHPDRRWEIWDNRAPCVIAFCSEEEARLRFKHFAEDICRWEQAPLPKSWADCEMVEAGRFRLMRRDRRIHLEIAVDGLKYRELLQWWTHKEAWDWGEN